MKNGLRDQGLLDEDDMEWVRRQAGAALLPGATSAAEVVPGAGVAGSRRRRGPSTVA